MLSFAETLTDEQRWDIVNYVISIARPAPWETGGTLDGPRTNPATILSFIAVFGVLRVGVGADYVSAGTVVAGVFVGSALWWLTLSIGVGVLRAKFDANAMKWMNRISGFILTGCGVGALISLIA